MRIAMLGWEFPPFVSGGLGVHCYYLTKELSALGVQIDFFMPRTQGDASIPWLNLIQVDSGRTHYKSKWWPIGPYDGAQQIRGGVKGNGKGYDGLEFFSAINAYNRDLVEAVVENHEKSRYDLIVAHDWITSQAAVVAARRTGLPMVLTIHSTELDRVANINPFQWILSIEKEGIAGADRVITVSKRSAKRITEELGCPAGKVDVVYNAVDSSSFKSNVKREEFGFHDGVVLFHGRLSIQKGPEFFLQAAKLVLEHEKKARFVVSGKGDMLKQLVNQAIDLGIADKVTFTGYLPPEQLADLYAVADVYVFPSVSEPFGITVLEAMAAGTPVILSKTTGAAEIVDHVLKVDFWDTQDMATKILALLKHSALRETLTKRGLEEVSGITWDKTARQTLQVYQKALASKGKG